MSGLDAKTVHRDPLVQFQRWFDEWLRCDPLEPNAMTLATADRRGRPSARIVLLKGVDENGFVFFTNYRSAKGRELDANPRGALVFWFASLERQVRIFGRVKRVSRRDTEAYFRSRPRGSQLSAWASPQSAAIASRAALDRLVDRVERKFGEGPIPAPPHWGGYRLVPSEIEFWQGHADRLHDRIRYRRTGGRWKVERLAP